MKKLSCLALMPLLWVSAASGVRAQDGYANQLFEPQPVQGRAILGVGTSHGLLQGEYSLGVFAHYEDDPMTLVNPDDHSQVLSRLIDSRFTTDVLGAVGILDWLQLGVALPIIVTQSGDDLAPVGRGGESVGSALGDLRVIPQFTILGGEEGFGLHVAVVLSLPTGDEANFAGDGAVRIRPVLGLGYAAGGYRVGFEAGYEIRSERRASSYVSDDMLRWALGGRIPLMPGMLGLLLSTQGTVQTAEGVDPLDPDEGLSDAPTVSLEALLGVELTVADGLVINAGAGTAFVHAAGTPDVRAFVGLSWTSPAGGPTDDDGDGILDDDCPDAAEDKDGFKDEDGCPDLDNDKDGVPDVADRCPNEPGDKASEGCLVVDQDRDGLLDPDDKCPTEPEDKDGFQDEDGCPDLDNDGDGVPDLADRCPDKAEDKDGFDDADGCPDPDNDGDGILDGADKCPDRPEVMNGVEDTDGCPDTAEKGVQITPTEVKVDGKINFPRDSDKITADSFATLDTVVRVLQEHPYLTKVRIEGHTDSEGIDTVNLDLSKRRAAAVVAYLVGKGVAATRLVSEGYGESRPLMKNDTPMGRAKNRRVEFRILEVGGKAVPEAAPTPL